MQAQALQATPALPTVTPPAAPKPSVQFYATPSVKAVEGDQIMYKVRDLLATDPAHCPRIHELQDARGQIVKYTFKDAETYVKMPMSMATKLIGNDGFQVLNERDQEMRAQRIDTDDRGVILSYDQTVARYEELTHEALLNRATLAGGAFKKNSPKDEMISYLIEKSLSDATPSSGNPAAEGEIELEEVDELA